MIYNLRIKSINFVQKKSKINTWWDLWLESKIKNRKSKIKKGGISCSALNGIHWD